MLFEEFIPQMTINKMQSAIFERQSAKSNQQNAIGKMQFPIQNEALKMQSAKWNLQIETT